MRKLIYSLVILGIFLTFNFAQNVEVIGTFPNQDRGGYMSDVWGYDAPDGRYYAISGSYNGVSVFDVTDPANLAEIGFFPGVNSIWRDIKTYKHYAYIVNDAGDGGVLILDLSTAPDSVRFVDNVVTPNFHNLYIDTTTATMYLANASFSGAVSIVSLANPEEPVHIRDFGTEAHDLYVRDNIAYVAQGNHGTLGIYNVSDLNNPATLKEISVPNHGYVHNTWLSKNSNYMISTEETANKTLKIWDISDLNNIEIVSEYLGPSKLQHNAHVEGDYIYLSHYESGLSILDIHDPVRPVLVGYYDTYPESDDAHFNGNWGVFPHSKSGNIYLSDQNRGLFVAKFNHAQADFFEGTISDKDKGSPLNNAIVRFEGFDTDFITDQNGKYDVGFGLADTVSVKFSAIGFKSFSQEIVLVGGETHSLDVELETAPKTVFKIMIKDEHGEPIENAALSFKLTSIFLDEDETFSALSNENGIVEYSDLNISDDDIMSYIDLEVYAPFPFALYELAEFTLNELETNEMEIILDKADVLLINGDPSSNYGNFIQESLEEIGKKDYSFNLADSVKLPSVENIKKLNESYLIWITGDAVENVLSQTAIDTIKAFLMSGGNVLLSGQNIAEYLHNTSNPFLKDWLHVNYLENMKTKIMSGDLHQISNDVLRVGVYNEAAANNQDSPDAFELDGNKSVKPVFEYLNSNGKYSAVGIEYQDYSSKLFFAGFGLEAVYPNNQNYISREDLLTRISDWFDSPLGIKDILSTTPETYQLKQNYPNPFNPSTTIEYNLPENTNVKIELFTLTGQKVKTLVNGPQNKGRHFVNFKAENLASGIYFYKLETKQFTKIRRMVLIQ